MEREGVHSTEKRKQERTDEAEEAEQVGDSLGQVGEQKRSESQAERTETTEQDEPKPPTTKPRATAPTQRTPKQIILLLFLQKGWIDGKPERVGGSTPPQLFRRAYGVTGEGLREKPRRREKTGQSESNENPRKWRKKEC